LVVFLPLLLLCAVESSSVTTLVSRKRSFLPMLMSGDTGTLAEPQAPEPPPIPQQAAFEEAQPETEPPSPEPFEHEYIPLPGMETRQQVPDVEPAAQMWPSRPGRWEPVHPRQAGSPKEENDEVSDLSPT
jgi:hypothetical protein